MGEFLQAIGGIFLFGLLIYIMMQYQSNKEELKKSNRELAKHSWKAKEFIREYSISTRNENPIMSKDNYNKKLSEILNNPEERKLINESIIRDREYENRIKVDNKRKRKIGYKYDIEIFEIFGTNNRLSKSELLKSITLKYNKNEIWAIEVMNIWLENNLITQCYNNKQMYKVGNVLEDSFYKIDEEDIIRNEWLKKQDLEF
ncbi:hypothetical protein SAMN06265371_108210 [Lutibacter agarilyticus]|uniref:Uncharacterized protein n=1 Tax=Lutibacter agarilyticus TaxID=1109740 RepID=A0A238YBZ9_9FLAO|nr:hypothetical protein [Lutibacter agarilyticus]SNR68550.1 hypothetical protein SAMN06265371_108210 [Lutibacter agarilyticus]